ncbi:Protein ZC21.3 b [Aphelenchoides avenae]|nr:Protein ZC21.3 b [Aphelenchus avenae]
MAKVWRLAGAYFLLFSLAIEAQVQQPSYQITATVCCGSQGLVGVGGANAASNQAGCVPCPPQGYNYPYSSTSGGYGSAAGGGTGQFAYSNGLFGQSANSIQGGQPGGFAQPDSASFGSAYTSQQGQYGNGQYGYQQPQTGYASSGFASGQGGQAPPPGEPGYLPNYVGDRYTNPQRIEETRALNAPFYQSIGGEPNYGTGANGGRGFGYSPYNQQPQYDASRGYSGNNYASSGSYQSGTRQFGRKK